MLDTIILFVVFSKSRQGISLLDLPNKEGDNDAVT